MYVTYEGPEDPRDGTTELQVGDKVFPVGVAVEANQDEVKALESLEGHGFKTTKTKPKAEAPEETTKPEGDDS